MVAALAPCTLRWPAGDMWPSQQSLILDQAVCDPFGEPRAEGLVRDQASTMPYIMGATQLNAEKPTIVVTKHCAVHDEFENLETLDAAPYRAALERAGGHVVLLDESASPQERADTLSGMDGLLLTGGADLDPSLYGQEADATGWTENGRDRLEKEAWEAARALGTPVLGICRGMQAINVFSGGLLVQHVDGHDSPLPPDPEAHGHSLTVRAASALAKLLGLPGGGQIATNSYHHQAVPIDGVASGLVAVGTTESREGTLVEAIESAVDGEFIVGVQCHPERPEFTTDEFRHLWRAFIHASQSGRSARVR